jgi:cytoskeletal protein CcmA (bactofilin family)
VRSPACAAKPVITARAHLRLFMLAVLSGVLALLVLPGSAAASPFVASAPDGGKIGAPGSCTGGSVVAYGRSLVIAPEQSICGDANAFGGSVQVAGRVGGNVTAFGGSVTVLGEVDGNVTAVGGSVSLGPGARVAGDVQAWGGSVHREHGAQVSGVIETGDRLAGIVDGQWPGASYAYAFPWPWILGWAVVAAIVVTLFPERTARVRMVASSAAVRSVFVGLLTALLGLFLAALLFATCIGIPLSLLVMAGLGAGWVLGTVAVGLWLGERILRAVAPERQSALLPAIVGVVLLAGVESIPCVGGVVAVVASSLGLGAALLSRFGGRRRNLSLPAPIKPVS